MQSVQNAAIDDDEEARLKAKVQKTKYKPPKKVIDTNKFLKRNKLMEAREFFNDDLAYPHMKYSKEANYQQNDKIENDDEWHRQSHHRIKRATRPKEENRNTCSLYIQTDPLIWRHIREGIADVSKKFIALLVLNVNHENKFIYFVFCSIVFFFF